MTAMNHYDQNYDDSRGGRNEVYGERRIVRPPGICEKTCGACQAMVAGVVVIFLSVFLIFYNERQYVTNSYDTDFLRTALEENTYSSWNQVDNLEDNTPVLFRGNVELDAPAQDTQFGVTWENALQVTRNYEIYQWVETKTTKRNKLANGDEEEVDVYKYNQQWSSGNVNSNNFRERQGHHNTQGSYSGAQFSANARLNGVPLTTNHYDWRKDLIADSSTTKIGSGQAASRANCGSGRKSGNYCCFGPGDCHSPSVGTERISFSISIAPRKAAIMGTVADGDNAFKKWVGPASGSNFGYILKGRPSVGTVIGQIESDNAAMRWGFRLLAFVAMFLGIHMALALFHLLIDTILCCGLDKVAGCGLCLGEFIVALVLWLGLTVIAWTVSNPYIFFSLMAALLGVLYLKGDIQFPAQKTPKQQA